jgi:aminoglycoside 6'-N-acetyltransferase
LIAFAPLRRDDMPLVREWLSREHVRRWWRDPEASIASCEEALAGRDPAEHYLIVADDRLVGMIQTYLVADNPEWAALIGIGEGAAGVDLLIGEPEQLGRGLGPEILATFTREIVFANPRVDTVVATVDEENRRSWRAFEKAGFRKARNVVEDGRPHRLMRLDRGGGTS